MQVAVNIGTILQNKTTFKADLIKFLTNVKATSEVKFWMFCSLVIRSLYKLLIVILLVTCKFYRNQIDDTEILFAYQKDMHNSEILPG